VEATSRRTERDGDINSFGALASPQPAAKYVKRFPASDQSWEGGSDGRDEPDFAVLCEPVQRSPQHANLRMDSGESLPPAGGGLSRNRLRERRYGGAPRGRLPSGAVRRHGPRPAATRRGTGSVGEAVPERPPDRPGASDRGHAGAPVPGRVFRCGLRLRRDPPRESEAPRLRERATGLVGDRSRPEADGIPGLRGNRAQGEDSSVAPRSRLRPLRRSAELEARVRPCP